MVGLILDICSCLRNPYPIFSARSKERRHPVIYLDLIKVTIH